MSPVVPIPKSSVYTDNRYNCRPISLLPVVSKLLEKHIHNVMLEHLIKQEMLTGDQWGFTSEKSTVTAFLSTFYDILQLLESGANVALVFLIHIKPLIVYPIYIYHKS